MFDHVLICTKHRSDVTKIQTRNTCTRERMVAIRITIVRVNHASKQKHVRNVFHTCPLNMCTHVSAYTNVDLKYIIIKVGSCFTTIKDMVTHNIISILYIYIQHFARIMPTRSSLCKFILRNIFKKSFLSNTIPVMLHA